MNTELHEYLDGERSFEDLSPELQAEARAFESLVAEARAQSPAQSPAWMENAVMSEVAAMPAHRAPAGLLSWLLRPRTVSMSPLTGLVTATAVVLLLLLPRVGNEPPAPVDLPAVVAEVYVEFSLEAPGATSVSVAGDFSAWEEQYLLDDADGDGVWTGRVPMRPGVHQYMFVVDGSEWVTDPKADRYSDDGFGNRNAVLAVSPPASMD